MQLVLEEDLPAPPAAAWPFLTDPQLMRRWSAAEVRLLAPGDGGSPAGVGAVREIAIRLARVPVSFREVIVDSQPPGRLVYRVVGGLPLRFHRGVITLEPSGTGTFLRWEVDYDFLLPGVGHLARVVLARQLRRSLAVLVDAVRGAPPQPCPPPRVIDDGPDLARLYAEAEAVLAQQRALALRLTAAGDPKQWFARVYVYVTENQLAACREGRVQHPGWVLRIIPVFHEYYARNLRRWLGEEPGWPEEQWRRAFRAMERGARWRSSPDMLLFLGLLMGIRAHIEEDLPRALARVHARHYAGRCDLARFRADYLLMPGVFHDASERLTAEIPAQHLPLWLRLALPRLPPLVRGELRRRGFYDVARNRRTAFERGERIAHLLLERAGEGEG